MSCRRSIHKFSVDFECFRILHINVQGIIEPSRSIAMRLTKGNASLIGEARPSEVLGREGVSLNTCQGCFPASVKPGRNISAAVTHTPSTPRDSKRRASFLLLHRLTRHRKRRARRQTSRDEFSCFRAGRGPGHWAESHGGASESCSSQLLFLALAEFFFFPSSPPEKLLRGGFGKEGSGKWLHWKKRNKVASFC
jgi:hypothetical protein